MEKKQTGILCHVVRPNVAFQQTPTDFNNSEITGKTRRRTLRGETSGKAAVPKPKQSHLISKIICKLNQGQL
ncbi:hypothetical protein OJAV_G00215850 [Oryzias javanicus]|uniref:Uncharacterized protein n=1 Tax=Oryzias javanicus TaxID=123683 RepID=A0A3S2P4Z5_ORYJA|nr:hypothetical protein OJAV_G00215850 [Oryzias javanicus]